MSPGQRWIAALGDKAWAPGMRAATTYGFTRLRDTDGLTNLIGWTPDVTDPATLGAMLGIVRGLLDSPTFRTDALHVCRREGRWEAWTDTHAYEWATGESEAEVLVVLAEVWKAS